MRLFGLFLLALCLGTASMAAASPEADCGCDVTLRPRAGETELYINGQTLGIQPGQKVCIMGGTYYHVFLFNFFGTADRPITITNCTGQVKISGNAGYGFLLNNSRNIHVTGSGDPSHNYGFLIDGTVAQQSVAFAMGDHTTDIELDHIEIYKAGAGFIYAPTPNCNPATWGSNFTIRNLSLHHNYVHDNAGEAFYIGSTSNTYNFNCNGSPVSVNPQVIHGLKIYNNLIERSGWDGIQVASSPVGVEIYNNIIRQHGVLNRDSQQSGIILGGVTSGSVHNNLVLGGTGNSFECFGVGLVKVYNNVFANGGYNGTALGQHAVLIASRPTPAGYPKLTVQVINNTIVSPKRSGVVMYNEYAGIGTGNLFANNLIINPGALSISPILGYFDVQIPAGDVSFVNNISKPTVGDVKFIDPANNNFNLQPSSMAVDAGMNASGYGVTQDFLYNNRPGGSAFDVGAYEYMTTAQVNQAPVAAAGADQNITLPVTQVTLNGGASDADGSITLLNWRQQSGPAQSTIVNSSNVATVVNGLSVAGVYEFILTVTDNDGATDDDVVIITVNAIVPPPATNYPAPLPNEPGPLKYRYYQYTGTWNNLPSLHALNATSTGTLSNITISPRMTDDRFAFLWEGYINIPVTGTYTFRTTSDDGSQFWIGDLPGPLINNDGLHGPQEKDGTITLNAGVYPIAALYYDQAYGEVMFTSWKTPQSGDFVQIPNSAFVDAPVVNPPPPPPTSGVLKYRYYTFSGTWYHMPNLHSLNPTATGTVDNITLANRTQNDRFAYLWEGFINIPVSGDYTFRTTSDDGSQFWIGSLPAPLVLNDGLHGPQDREGTVSLNAGVYPIAVLYYEQDGGETMVLSWKTPQTGGSYVQVPGSAFVEDQVTTPPPPPTPPVVTAGLNYKYYTYSGTWNALPNFSTLTPAATGRVANVSVAPRTRNDNFAFMWEGYINIPVTGTYTFRTNSDDGSKLYIGPYNYSANALVNNDGLHGAQDRDGTITLNAGVHPITITFFEQDSREFIYVYWKTPQTGNSFVTIPDNAFTSPTGSESPDLTDIVSVFNSNALPKLLTDEQASASINKDLGSGLSKLSVFPNPAVDLLNLRLSDAETGAVQVSITNAQGAILQNKRLQKGTVSWNQQVNVANLKPGYYILQVKGKTLNYKQSFIKK